MPILSFRAFSMYLYYVRSEVFSGAMPKMVTPEIFQVNSSEHNYVAKSLYA